MDDLLWLFLFAVATAFFLLRRSVQAHAAVHRRNFALASGEFAEFEADSIERSAYELARPNTDC